MKSSHRLSNVSRVLMAVASLLLLGLFFLPAWRIDLFAPQYPEGLMMNIWINRISGDVEIINGLNHYIGMKPFTSESFPEFKYLYLIVIFFMLFGLVVSFTGKSSLLKYFLIVSLFGGCTAMYDFYQWGAEFGRDLDPKAAIQIPGLSYQPPVFGHKRLLNFDAYSFPDIGGWLVVIAVAIAACIYFFENYKVTKSKFIQASIGVSLFVFLSSCITNPEPISIGKDQCAHCKMAIMDSKYAAEIITGKGKVVKFDDIVCMNNYLYSNKRLFNESTQFLVSDYNLPAQLIKAESADYYQSENIQTPMGGHIIAVSKNSTLPSIISNEPVKKLTWSELIE